MKITITFENEQGNSSENNITIEEFFQLLNGKENDELMEILHDEYQATKNNFDL